MAKVTRREQHVPLAYIRGKAAFYGHIFYITKDVLVPRPESEAIIDILANLSDLPAAVRIADIGTGSGCLGITAALILPDAQVWLYDIDSQALDVARKNTQIHGVDATLTQQDLLTGVTEPFDIILANLPYVPTAYPINSAATFEPAVALFAGDDGLADYRRFWQQIGDAAHKPTHIITEALLAQHPALADIAKGVGYQLIKTNGLIQHYAL
jgi:release factor glutamine methyltransferase